MNKEYYRNGVCCLKDDVLQYCIWNGNNYQNLEAWSWDPPFVMTAVYKHGHDYMYPEKYEDVVLEDGYDVFVYNTKTEQVILLDRLFFDTHYTCLNSKECCEKEYILDYSVYLGPYEVYPDWVVTSIDEWKYFTNTSYDLSLGENVALRNKNNEKRIITLDKFTKEYKYGIPE